MNGFSERVGFFSEQCCFVSGQHMSGQQEKVEQHPGNNEEYRMCACTTCTHFPSGLDSFPDAEEADNPHCQETEGQVPLQGPDVLDPSGDAQDVASVEDTEPQGTSVAVCVWISSCRLFKRKWVMRRRTEVQEKLH